MNVLLIIGAVIIASKLYDWYILNIWAKNHMFDGKGNIVSSLEKL